MTLSLFHGRRESSPSSLDEYNSIARQTNRLGLYAAIMSIYTPPSTFIYYYYYSTGKES